LTTITGGTLALANSTSTNSLGNSTRIVVGTVSGSSAKLDVTGLSNGTLVLNAGQTLAGHGTVTGDVTGVSGSTIAPGNSPGILTVDGNLSLGQGNLGIALSKTSIGHSPVAGTEYSQLAVTTGNTVDITDGTLVLTLGNNVEAGDVYYILDNQDPSFAIIGSFTGTTINGAAATGSFADNGQFTAGIFTFNISYDTSTNGTFNSGSGNDIALQVVSAPEPTSLGLIGLGGMGLLARRRRARRKPSSQH